MIPNEQERREVIGGAIQMALDRPTGPPTATALALVGLTRAVLLAGDLIADRLDAIVAVLARER